MKALVTLAMIFSLASCALDQDQQRASSTSNLGSTTIQQAEDLAGEVLQDCVGGRENEAREYADEYTRSIGQSRAESASSLISGAGSADGRSVLLAVEGRQIVDGVVVHCNTPNGWHAAWMTVGGGTDTPMLVLAEYGGDLLVDSVNPETETSTLLVPNEVVSGAYVATFFTIDLGATERTFHAEVLSVGSG